MLNRSEVLIFPLFIKANLSWHVCLSPSLSAPPPYLYPFLPALAQLVLQIASNGLMLEKQLRAIIFVMFTTSLSISALKAGEWW